MLVDVVIPALDESEAIGAVVRSVLRPPVRSVVVVDNGSRDGTGDVARAAGARVVREPRRGYGAACLAGIRALPPDGDVVVFLDGDGSDDPSWIPRLLAPIRIGAADLVVGSRSERAEPGALTVQQRLGNAIAAAWLRARFGLPASDLGPLRAIRRRSLGALCMSDQDYGWTVEMQIKAARAGLRYQEVSVPYRRRRGRSKISGTVRGTLGAGSKILGLLAWYDLIEQAPPRSPDGDAPGSAARISVVIPVLDEEARIGRCLDELARLDGLHEVIVVDGGSRDRTVELAGGTPGVRVLTAPRGRGPQLNAGARAATGDVLLFLHADVSLPPAAPAWIAWALGEQNVVGGAFRTWTVRDGPTSWIAPFLHLADLRSHYTRLPYGDQAIFARREAFLGAGGCPDQPLLEDLELSRRLRRVGRLVTVPAYVHVSGRRFLRHPLRATVAANSLPFLYRLGASADSLARFWGPVR